jgi:hypothetical protein
VVSQFWDVLLNHARSNWFMSLARALYRRRVLFSAVRCGGLNSGTMMVTVMASIPSLKASMGSMGPLLIFAPPAFVAIGTEMINAS